MSINLRQVCVLRNQLCMKCVSLARICAAPNNVNIHDFVCFVFGLLYC